MSDTFELALSYNETGKIYKEEGGNRPVVYLDSKGKPTAGIGHLLTDEENYLYKVGERVPRQVRGNWYATDLLEAADDTDAYLKGMKIDLIPDGVICIVYHMAFQLGRGSLFGFKQTRKAIKARDFKWASNEMLDSDWYREDTPRRAKRLAERMEDLA